MSSSSNVSVHINSAMCLCLPVHEPLRSSSGTKIFGGLYHTSILKSFTLSNWVSTLEVGSGSCIGPSYTGLGNLLLQLSLLQRSLHNFRFPGSSFPSSSGWKNSFSQNFSPCAITQFHTTGSLLGVRCQIIRE